jgi:GT2 family glycosyltransferase
MADSSPISVVVPNWNGRRWLGGCLESIARQERPPAEVIVVDNGSDDGSLDYLAAEWPTVRVLALGHNTGFAHAANRGLWAARCELVALVNTDVELAPDWTARMATALYEHSGAAAAACKMLSMQDPSVLYAAGDVLRRDGACEQIGRFRADRGAWDEPGEVFGACAGAALYRRRPVCELGGFDERYFAYLEDVDLSLRLRLAGWSCRYVPVAALHAGEGSSHQLAGGHVFYVARNTLMLVAKAFPVRWLPLVFYRQLGAAWHAARDRRLRAHVRGLVAAAPLLRAVRHERSSLLAGAHVPIELVIRPRPKRSADSE